MSRHWKISTCRHFQNGRHNTAKIQHCPISPLAFDVVFMLSWLLILIIISILFSMYPELKIKKCKKKSSTYAFYFYSPSYYSIHYHNTAKIQHCPISKFDMWVDNDVPNWFPTSKKLYRSPFSKWPPQCCTSSTLFDFNDYSIHYLQIIIAIFQIFKPWY
jgi:hypothetical protein